MATNFPTSLDVAAGVGSVTGPVPSTTDTTDTPSHAALHQTTGDAVVAVEGKVGTGASTPTTNTVLTGTGSGTSAWGAVSNAQAGFTFDAVSPALTWTQGTTITHTVVYAKRMVLGKSVHIRAVLTATSAGVAVNPMAIGNFAAAADANSIGGSWRYLNGGSPSTYCGTVISGGTTSTAKFTESSTSSSFGTAVTVGIGDRIEVDIFYELA